MPYSEAKRLLEEHIKKTVPAGTLGANALGSVAEALKATWVQDISVADWVRAAAKRLGLPEYG
ncbi:hypothetical protein SAMN05444161_7043 [Rhizobiales bacterium GAS191]|nr:hypothetical protein SAMN05444161_7043 [Rhizobiales bacterium GAS191]